MHPQHMGNNRIQSRALEAAAQNLSTARHSSHETGHRKHAKVSLVKLNIHNQLAFVSRDSTALLTAPANARNLNWGRSCLKFQRYCIIFAK